MVMQATETTELLAELIEARHATLGELRTLSALQYRIVTARDLAKLVELLAAKQRQLEQLRRLDAALAPFREDDPEARVWADPARREQCRQLAAESAAWMGEVMELEAAAEKCLAAQRDETVQELDRETRRFQAISAYRDRGSTEGSGWAHEG